jgi:mevalonate kinase
LITTKLYTDFSYPSKLILFGEYTVLFEGNALAIPYEKYFCKWARGRSFEHPHLGIHISKIVENYPLLNFDFSHWSNLTSHSFLETNIPLGYGLGSSGAVVAAIFDQFFDLESFKGDLLLLKTFLGEIESYFHGRSSGLDPLICLLKKPLLVEKDKISVVELDSGYLLQFELIDSKTARQNKTAIQSIVQRYETNAAFFKACNELKALNSAIISNYLKANFDKTGELVRDISRIQLEYFGDLIPPIMQTIWKDGLADKRNYLKLCGGGGGGFFYKFSL